MLGFELPHSSGSEGPWDQKPTRGQAPARGFRAFLLGRVKTGSRQKFGVCGSGKGGCGAALRAGGWGQARPEAPSPWQLGPRRGVGS